MKKKEKPIKLKANRKNNLTKNMAFACFLLSLLAAVAGLIVTGISDIETSAVSFGISFGVCFIVGLIIGNIASPNEIVDKIIQKADIDNSGNAARAINTGVTALVFTPLLAMVVASTATTTENTEIDNRLEEMKAQLIEMQQEVEDRTAANLNLYDKYCKSFDNGENKKSELSEITAQIRVITDKISELDKQGQQLDVQIKTVSSEIEKEDKKHKYDSEEKKAEYQKEESYQASQANLFNLQAEKEYTQDNIEQLSEKAAGLEEEADVIRSEIADIDAVKQEQWTAYTNEITAIDNLQNEVDSGTARVRSIIRSKPTIESRFIPIFIVCFLVGFVVFGYTYNKDYIKELIEERRKKAEENNKSDNSDDENTVSENVSDNTMQGDDVNEKA